MLIGDHHNINNTKVPYRKAKFKKNLDYMNLYSQFGRNITFIPSCILFPKLSLYNKKWNEELTYSEDWDFYLNIASAGYVFKNYNENFVIYRNSNFSLSKNKEKVLKSNYIILNQWKNINRYTFIYRTAQNYLNCIKFALFNQSVIIHPPIFKDKKYVIYSLVILLALIVNILLDIKSIIFKRFIKK